MTVCVIVSTYNQPGLLDRSLFSLKRQTCASFEIIVADDGSEPATRSIVENHKLQNSVPLKHVWQKDDGFRKTRILNKAILATDADYLIFTDGDCIAHADFVQEHLLQAEAGHYLNGSMVRLRQELSGRIGQNEISDGKAFDTKWLTTNGGGFNRRYLRFALGYTVRTWLNRVSATRLYWLGCNSSCFKSDAMAVNGFDHRFTYGFEDGDFGYRLENFGLTPKTVRWTANLLHLWHERPWSSPEVMEYNRGLMATKESGGRYRAMEGLEELVAVPATHRDAAQQDS